VVVVVVGVVVVVVVGVLAGVDEVAVSAAVDGAELVSVLASTAGESIGELLTSTHPVDIMIPANPAIAKSLRDPKAPMKCLLCPDIMNMCPPCGSQRPRWRACGPTINHFIKVRTVTFCFSVSSYFMSSNVQLNNR
jgi:hypothetical protein